MNKDIVGTAKKTVTEAIDAYHWAVPSLNLEIGKELLKYNADKKKGDVLKEIFSGELNDAHKDMNEKRVKNTGDWFTETEEFNSWIYGDTPLLTCSGRRTWQSHGMLTFCLAGAGKSFITFLSIFYIFLHRSRVIQEIYERCSIANKNESVRVGISHVYLRYDQKNLQTASFVIRSPLVQLVYQLDGLPQELESAVADKSRGRVLSVDEYVKFIAKFSRKFHRVFIVLDALDELEKSSFLDLVDHLKFFLENGIKLYYSVRPDLLLSLTTEGVDIEVIAKEYDIRRFVEYRLDKADYNHTLRETQKSTIIEKIVTEAKGMYAVYSVIAKCLLF